ncbi:hypothetical protein SAMN04487770_1214 [Butyrivibrio sp. ob235]|uniref:hypothetical protein n=1 Tax=Butyrivibrio sp. ob235 TaxID=1761780 RepID=UPI0008B11DFF|nr:hypothetical protein [Butyrivibrio sp. ob235]SEL92251.1 hypothetical protein SAMN04487770_1214 [Butyrivibrio sp. ob235]
MFETDDKSVLLDAYNKIASSISKRPVAKDKYMDIRAEIIKRIDKSLLVSRDIYFTELEKQHILKECKSTYKDYCGFINGNPTAKTTQLIERKNALLDLMISFEIQSILRFKNGLGEDLYLDLRSIFSNRKYKARLMKDSVQVILKDAVDDPELSAIKKVQLFYTTRAGKKFHLQGCPYCAGKMLCAEYEYMLIDKRIKPCRCVTKNNEIIKEKKLKEQEEQYITAFVDESLRDNTGHYFDETLGMKQNVFSILMCKGMLRNEHSVTENGIIGQYIHVAERTEQLQYTTIEAIGTVMLKASLTGFSKNLIIYTDNQGVCNTWRKIPALEFLARSFSTVKIRFIRREKNKLADHLIRDNDIIVISKEKTKKLLEIYSSSQEQKSYKKNDW